VKLETNAISERHNSFNCSVFTIFCAMMLIGKRVSAVGITWKPVVGGVRRELPGEPPLRQSSNHFQLDASSASKRASLE
jgi:hypothetical protein